MDNVYSSARPFYVFAKLLGAFPLSYVGKPSQGVLKVKPLDVVITGLSFLTLIVFILMEVQFEKLIKSDSTVLTKASKAVVVATLLLLLLSFFYQISKRHEIKRFMDQLFNFDEEVRLQFSNQMLKELNFR